MFQLLAPSASGNITLAALRTIILPGTTSAFTLTIQPGTIIGQECLIIGGSGGTTVQSNVSSGAPAFDFPDSSVGYSFTLSDFGDSMTLVWDGANWHVRTFGQTVVGNPAAQNQAAPLSYLQANFAAINNVVNSFNGRQGTVSLTSGDVTGALGYAPANLAGSAGQQFNVANASASSEAVALGQFLSSRNAGGPVIIQRPDGLIYQFGTGTVTASGTVSSMSSASR